MGIIDSQFGELVKRFRFVYGITLLVGALLLGVTGVASAASSTPPPAKGHRVYATLKVVGFDAAVAKKNGYQVKTDAAGHQYAVKVTPSGAVQSSVTPQDSLGGCGGAYIDYEAVGNKQAWVYSGWYLDSGLTADYFYWRIPVTDNAGTGERYWYGPLAAATGWYIPTGWKTTHSVTGYSWAEVSYGQIKLTNGDICEVPPGALWASTTLY
jgi:hypothetical protein